MADGRHGLARRAAPSPGLRRAGFHAISESTRDDLVARGVPAARIRVIHPGVDGQPLSPLAGSCRAPPNRRFLYVGRLKRYKGIGLAIEALAARSPIAARPATRHRRHRRPSPGTRAAGRRARPDRRCGFHGFVSEEQKISLLRTAWANLFPSPKEGWGITVVEAAACGTPSLASDSPGLRDSVMPILPWVKGTDWPSARAQERLFPLLADEAVKRHRSQSGTNQAQQPAPPRRRWSPGYRNVESQVRSRPATQPRVPRFRALIPL